MVSFSRFPLKPDAASKMPFQILGVDERKAFAFLMEVILLETGEHAARKNWQLGQLTNLLQHASSRSQFWRERLGGKKASQIKLSRIPKLTRADLNRQVSEEGALLSEKDGVSVRKNTTSGSTGAPVSFFVSSPNGFYNEVREFAQYIIENRDLRLNRCRFVFDPWHPGYSFQEQSSYAGIFSWLFSTGRNAEIRYLRADLEQIIKKMEVYHPHYFVCLPQFVETMIHNAGTEVFKKIDVRFFVMYGNAISPEVRNASRELSIPIRSSYSCEECGLIGSECTENPGHYHVAESNVIVTPGDEQIEYEGAVCRNVLLTALHSYASPIIRYDVGDFASLAEECPCGHRGQTIHNLLGRVSTTLKMSDGRRKPFHIGTRPLQAVTPYEDLRVRQKAFNAISVEIVSKERNEEVRHRLVQHFQGICGSEFSVNIEFCDRIDWGPSRKRLAFLCET